MDYKALASDLRYRLCQHGWYSCSECIESALNCAYEQGQKDMQERAALKHDVDADAIKALADRCPKSHDGKSYGLEEQFREQVSWHKRCAMMIRSFPIEPPDPRAKAEQKIEEAKSESEAMQEVEETGVYRP